MNLAGYETPAEQHCSYSRVCTASLFVLTYQGVEAFAFV